MKIGVLLVITLIIPCKGHKNLSQTDTRLITLTQAEYFPVEKPEAQIIESKKELNAFFLRVNSTRKPGLPVPDIDFENYVGLVACLGKKTSTGFPKMQITAEDDDEIIVNAIFKKDLEGTNFGYPFCIYKMIRTDKEIRIVILD